MKIFMKLMKLYLPATILPFKSMNIHGRYSFEQLIGFIQLILRTIEIECISIVVQYFCH